MKKTRRKKLLCLVLVFTSLAFLKPQPVSASEYWPEPPEIESMSAIVMELSTGTILYEKETQQDYYPASITKIMTTLIALENSDLNEVVTFSDNAIDSTSGSGIARDYGEQMSMEYCLYGVMLASANECAAAVAEHVGGTIDNFVAMMNKKAKELGCVNTHFNNPHGLPDENHYTCAYDMALIAQAAYQNETFRIITGTARYTIPPTNKHSEPTPLQNHNEMLYPFKHTKYVYEYCTGGKTGWTSVANSTLVTYAEKDGMSLVCVVMNVQAPGHWTDSRHLFDYAFDNFQIMNIVENETRYDSSENIAKGTLNNNGAFVKISDASNIVLPKTAEFMDTATEISFDHVNENVVGNISYTYAGRPVGKADIEKADVKAEEFVFQNSTAAQTENAREEEKTPDQKQDTASDQQKKTETPENETDRKPALRIHISPMILLSVLGGILALAVILFLLKKFIDNFYIIRHNRSVRKMRKKQFGGTRRLRRRNRRWRRR